MEETKTLKIEIPEGYEIDKEKSTFENIVFKKVENKFSKSWEEFCNKNPKKIGDAWINNESQIMKSSNQYPRSSLYDKNIIPLKFTEPMLALMQLLSIREKEYTKEWEPNWTDNSTKYCIEVFKNYLTKFPDTSKQAVLSFPTITLCNKFFENWKDLIEIAKPLL